MIVLTVLLAVLGVLALLFLAACLRAVLIKRHREAPALLPVDEEDALHIARHLSQMVQCETVNPKGTPSETVQATFYGFIALLAKLYPLTFARLERIPLKEALLLRWPGQNAGRAAVLLMAHSDVVPATGEWKYPPFSGTIAEGRVWGRGTVDIKVALCAILEAVEGLLAQGFVPACDVYIESSFNEEVMGPGAMEARDWFVQQGVQLDIVSDEGGSVVQAPMPGLEGWYAMMGLTEKGFANVRFTAKGTGGHASTPPRGTPLARLAAFICEMERRPPFKLGISQPISTTFGTLAPYMGFGWRLLLGNQWLFGPLVKRLWAKTGGQGAAMLRTTIAFTMAEGSPAPNVIPETASVTANMRSIMHEDMAASLAAVRRVAAKYDIETEVLYQNDYSPMVDTESAAYKYMLGCVEEVFPEAVATPFAMLGGTDSRHFAPLCPCTLRFAPVAVQQDQRGTMHGLDENIDVNALPRAVAFYKRVLTGWK